MDSWLSPVAIPELLRGFHPRFGLRPWWGKKVAWEWRCARPAWTPWCHLYRFINDRALLSWYLRDGFISFASGKVWTSIEGTFLEANWLNPSLTGRYPGFVSIIIFSLHLGRLADSNRVRSRSVRGKGVVIFIIVRVFLRDWFCVHGGAGVRSVPSPPVPLSLSNWVD